MQAQPPILFLTGPSGTGKSEICRYAHQQHGWLAMDVDLWQEDGFATHRLSEVWDNLCKTGRSRQFSDLVRHRAAAINAPGIIIGFASGFTPDLYVIRHLQPDIHIRYLNGLPEHCERAFLQREAKNGRNLTEKWWRANNLALCIAGSNIRLLDFLKQPELAPYTVNVFETDGRHRAREDIWRDLQIEQPQL